MAGLVVGGVVTVRIIQHQYRDRMNSATWTPRTMAWLQSTVHLTSGQEAKIRPVVENSMKKIADFRTRVEHERRQLFGELFAEVATHLTDEQRERLEQACHSRGRRQGVALQPWRTKSSEP